jgi:hypothetical protein
MSNDYAAVSLRCFSIFQDKDAKQGVDGNIKAAVASIRLSSGLHRRCTLGLLLDLSSPFAPFLALS